jgi:hypothetical protein
MYDFALDFNCLASMPNSIHSSDYMAERLVRKTTDRWQYGLG